MREDDFRFCTVIIINIGLPISYEFGVKPFYLPSLTENATSSSAIRPVYRRRYDFSFRTLVKYILIVQDVAARGASPGARPNAGFASKHT